MTKGKFLDFLKIRIKEISIRYCTKRNQKRKNNIKNCETKLKSLDDQLAINSSPHLTIKRREIKTELDHFYEADFFVNYVRSRASWIEHGEKSGSYFLNLEKKHQSFNKINK